MNKLKEYTKDFTVSRPIFRLHLSTRGGTIEPDISDSVYKYKPTPTEGDVLSALVCGNYREEFSIREGVFIINVDSIANNAMGEIRSEVVHFIEKNLPLRNPRQSKLYRWAYRNMPSNDEFNGGLILLYKYINERIIPDSIPLDHKVQHVKNVLAMLEAMMEKYSDEKE